MKRKNEGFCRRCGGKTYGSRYCSNKCKSLYRERMFSERRKQKTIIDYEAKTITKEF